MSNLLTRDPTPLRDFGNTPDIYIDGIGRIDNNGVISHVIMYMRQNLEGDRTSRIAAVRLIVPTAELASMARALQSPETVAETYDPDCVEQPTIQ